MKVKQLFQAIDKVIIYGVKHISQPAAHIALFVVFFWFGVLKLAGTSPANTLVLELFNQTFLTNVMSGPIFLVVLGLIEMIIGIFFILPHFERLAILLLVLHMLTTFLPLVLLPEFTWQSPWTPTLEGQYIMKNIVLVALAIGIAAHVRPYKNNK